MTMKQKRNMRFFTICSVCVLILMAAMAVCFTMVRTINQRMNASATSNLLNTTRVIQNTLQGSLEKELESLNIIGDFYKNGEYVDKGQADAFCESMGFDWICLVDAQGNGADYFYGKMVVEDLTCYEQWTRGERGYSNTYIGRSGRPQTGLWVPIHKDGEYIGTVFGGVIVSKYYSADIFTFYEGEGRTYLFDAKDGAWILKSLGTDGTTTRQGDIYSLLSASGNEEAQINAFRQAVEGQKTGTAVFDFNGVRSYLCFLPMTGSQNWYVTTVIPQHILLKESSEVLRMIRWLLVILCMTLVIVTSVFGYWWVQKTKTEEVHYREALFSNLSANLDSAFLIYDKQDKKTVFVSDNMKRLLGLDREWISQDTANLFDWCGISKEETHRIHFLEGTLEKPSIHEVQMGNELGEIARVIKLELIPADLGQEIAVLTDITKDKEIQNSLIEAMQQAEAAGNARNDFLSAMSHDLRTPINGIVGMTAIAAAYLEDTSRVRDCLSKISESTAHLLNLINEVLDMSQVENGKIKLAAEPFNLAELLQDVLNVNYPGIQQKNHTVRVHIHLMEHEEVIGDPARLTRIATNLISNAIKYTPSGGEIILTLQEKVSMIQGYGCYEITVQDNGIGMSSAFQKKLFEPFEREEDVRISRIQGTGLGMSIVKHIVDLMMGNIQVESEKGKGTTFRVTVNLLLDKQEMKLADQLAGLPVLVVDDDITACETTTQILCNIGMNGEWCDNGAEAVRMVDERHQKGKDYLAVLLDWKMPDMDGVETARRIRAQVGQQIPIIILTAYEWNEIEEEARAAGVDAFLSKPIYKAKLLQKMSEITEGSLEDFTVPHFADRLEIPAGKLVLLAEDNELNKEIAVELLRMLGVQSDCVENGVAAVEKFSGSEPGTYDMILMDIQMPQMNGYEACRRIRSLDRPDGQTIPIVAMTADAFKKDVQAAHEAGMDEHLAKPISIERLTQVLARFLSKY